MSVNLPVLRQAMKISVSFTYVSLVVFNAAH